MTTTIINLAPRKTVVTNQLDRPVVVYAVAGMGPVGPLGPYIQAFTLRDNPLLVGIGAVPFEWPMDGEVLSARVVLHTAPTGQAAIFNVRKEGAVWHTLTVPAGTRRSGPSVPADPTILEGEESTVDVVQRGSIIPGSIATFIFEVASQ